MTSVLRVFVSSTWQDLREERTVLQHALARMKDTSPAAMEVFGSRPDSPLEESLSEIDGSDIYVGIFAHRYNAAAILVLHNDPSGDPTRSSENVRRTRDVAEADRLLNISVLDHVIVGRRSISQ